MNRHIRAYVLSERDGGKTEEVITDEERKTFTIRSMIYTALLGDTIYPFGALSRADGKKKSFPPVYR